MPAYFSNDVSGSTPLGMYKKLIEYHKEGQLSFKYVKTFNMDEYVDIPRDHPESYHSFMWTNFFKHIDINPKNAHILDGNADDLDKECSEFEKNIKEAGGIHLFVGGMFHYVYSNLTSLASFQIGLIPGFARQFKFIDVGA